MKTITKITGLLILLASFGFANAAKIVASTPSISADKTELLFTISESAGGKPAPITNVKGDEKNVAIDIAFTGFELRGTKDDVTGLSTYFEVIGPDTNKNILLSQIAEIPIGISSAGGTFRPLNVTIPVTLTSDRNSAGEAGFEVIVRSLSASTFVEDPTAIPVKAFQAITGGGGATPPNYSIGMEIASGGNNLGASESKILPLNIIVTETANAANTAGNNVVVALAKDSRIDSVASDCGGADWSLDSTTSSVAYLFTYTANNNAFPANTPSTIVCPVTVTRPTTQSGKLQLNAVLRHGSGDTKTSNDVASIEVTYN